MKTPAYTKWFSFNPNDAALKAARSAPAAQEGSVLAHKEIHINKCPSNGEFESLDCACNVPFVAGNGGSAEPSLASATLALTVEDWGGGSISAASGSASVNCDNEEPGPLGGHATWGGSASLACGPGAVSLSAWASNIIMDNPDDNLFIFDCTMNVVFMEDGGQDDDDKADPCGCSVCSTDGGATPPTGRSSGALPDFSSSSAGTSVVATTTESKMVWSCNVGNLRGLGAKLSGKVELLVQDMSADLAKPAALQFNHPMAAHLVIPEGGLVPGTRFSFVNGAREIVFRYYDNGTIAPVGVDTYGGGRASLSGVDNGGAESGGDDAREGGEQVEGQIFTWRDESGDAWAFSAATGELISYSTDDGASIGNVAEYLAVVRDAADDSLRQIWSYWDGLLNIENVTDSGYTLALYTPAQVAGRGVDGLFTLAEGAVPFKSFAVSYEAETGALSIVQKSPDVPDYPVSWTQDAAGAWSMTKGSGADAIVIARTRTELEPASLMDTLDVWQLVTETSKAGAVASRVCEIYQSAPVGNLLLTKVEGYGGAQELTTTYTYDGVGNLLTETAPNGMVTGYVYDAWGRLLRVREPWGAADSGYTKIRQTDYADSEQGNFSSQPAKITEEYNTPQGVRQTLRKDVYSYSSANGIKRVEVRSTAAGTAGTQLTVTETYEGSVENIFARGRVRMTQAANAVQTWHEYAATDYEGALYTETIETRVAGQPVPGRSDRTVNYISCEGNTLRSERFVMLADGTWAKISGVTNTYDVQNRLTATVQDNGRTTSQALNCEGDPLWTIDEDGIRTDYAYNSARQLIETTRSEVMYNGTVITPETITEYTRDAEGRVLTTTTHTGAMETVSHTAYDLAGRVISETDILGRVTTTEYSEDALTTTVTLPSGATLITTTNPDGSVAREYGTGQREVLHGYDFINGLRETVKLPDGTILSQNITDGFGQTITQTAPTTLSNTYIYTRSVYNALGQMTRQTVGDMAPTVFEYGTMGQVTKQTVLLDASVPTDTTKNRITEFAYGYESMEDGVYQTTTTIGHNAEGGNLVTVQKSLASQLSAVLESKSISIDVHGNVSTQWTEYGAPTVRTSHVTIPTSDVTATATIIDGFTTTSTDNTGVTDTFTRAWTATGMVQTFTDGRGNTTTTHTDIAGRTISVTDAAGFTTTTEYCAFNDQPSVITNALGKTSCYRYDIRGRKVAEFGAAIQPALFGYDDADNLVALTTFRVDDATLSTDPADRTDGDTTQWAYNATTGLEMSKTYPDNTQVLKTYDSMNRIATVTNARGTVQTRTYATTTGLLSGITFSDSTTPQSFQYNVLGQLTQVTDAAGTRTFSYNEYAQQLTDSVNVGTSAYPVVEAYDTFGRNTGYELKKANSAFQTVGYGYDTKGQLSTCSFLHGGEHKAFTYNRLAGTHLLERLDSPNGMSRNYTYEPHRDLIATLNDKRGNTAVVNRSYTYNALGIPTNRTIQRQGSTRNDTFTHNDRSELTAATMGADNYAYDYDNIGNRKTAQEVANNFEYEANALNQYTQITENDSDFTPAFDLDGNQTRIKTVTGIWTATYNALNRPVRFENEAASIVITADYDYMGRRVFKKVETNNTVTSHLRFLYRGYLQIAALDMTRATQNAMWLITWDPTQPVATRPLAIQQSGTWYTYGIDLPKNITEVYGTNGYIVTTYTYSPYGLATSTGSVTQHIQWSSEYADTDLGLVYYNYRHYNPLDGRWLNRDLIESNNLYNYNNNIPNMNDYLGMFSLSGLNTYLEDAYRAKLYELVMSLGDFDDQILPKLFLRKYIFGPSTPYELSKEELLNQVKPIGSITSNPNFKADLKEHCSENRTGDFSGSYLVNFMDGGHKTAGLGRFNMQIDAEVVCCGIDNWAMSGKASFKTDRWDFDGSFEAAKEETIKLLSLKLGGKIPLLEGRELRTYLGSFIPGTSFDITYSGVIQVRQNSTSNFVMLF